MLQFSRSLAELLGFSTEELACTTFQELLPGNRNALPVAALDLLHQTSEEIKVCTFVRKDGNPIDFTVHFMLVESTGEGLIFCNLLPVEQLLDKEGEAKQSSAEAQLSLLLQYTEECFLVLDTALKIVEFNDQFKSGYARILGGEVEVGQYILNYTSTQNIEFRKAMYARVLKGERVVSEVEIPMGADKGSAYFSSSCKPIRDSQGNITGIFISIVDITEQKLAEKSVSVSEQRYKALVEYGMDVVVILTAEAKPLYVSPAVEKILGYNPEEAAQLDLFSLTHPDDVKEVTKVWEQVLQNPGLPIEGPTTRILHKNGSWRWLQDTITNMLHVPHINGIVDNFKDVTEKVHAERRLLQKQKELEQAEASYREIFEKANEGILIYDINTALLTEVNRKACELLGCSHSELMASSRKQYESSHPGYEISAAFDKFRKAVEGEAQSFEWPVKRKDGVETWLELSLTKANIAGEERVLAFFKVIDERKKAEQEREFQRIDKEALINSTSDLMWSVKNDRKLLAANEQFIKTMHTALGYDIEPGHELLLKGQFPEDVISFWERLYDRSFNGEMFTEEVFTPAHDTIPEMWTEISVNPVYQNEQVVFIACYARDISERKRQQEQIKLVNEKLEISQQIAKLGVWEFDLQSQELYSSAETLRIFGLEEKGAKNNLQTLMNLIHPEDKQYFNTEFQYALEGEKILNIEHRIVTSTGLVKTVNQRGSLRYDSGNIPVTFSGVTQDITDRKYLAEQLLASQRQLQLIYDTVNEVIFLIDVEADGQFRFQSVNRTFLTATGLEEKQVIGKSLAEIIPPDNYPFVLSQYQKAVLTCKPVSWEEISLYPSGEKTGLVSVSPIINSDGKCLQLIGSVHDITELNKSAERLVKLNEKLQQQAKALAESNLELEKFAYVASHDLQEPLRMVSSFLKLLEKKYEGDLDETAHKYIHYAVDGAERMKNLIIDLLAYSRVSTNDDVLASTDMNALVAEVLHIQNNTILKLGATIRVGPLPILQNTRRTQMFQLFQNLISNALKYHGEAPPQIDIYAWEQSDRWEFSVKDNGVGFEQEFAESIFIMFTRLHRRSGFTGSGIGLSVCKKIVEIHQGNIWVESVPGKGSTFYFTIAK